MFSQNHRICFILLPGFSPDYIPVLALKRILQGRGYSVLESNFFGTIKVDDFKKLTIDECLKNISDLIDETVLKYDKVVGIGVSLGGALLMEYAKKKNNLFAVASIGTPFKLRRRPLIHIGEFFLPIMYPLWRIFEKIRFLRLLPIGAAPEVIRYLENDFLNKLEYIHTSILFFHSKKDLVTDYKVLPYFSDKISSGKKKIILTENGSHVVDHDPEFIVNSLEDFLA